MISHSQNSYNPEKLKLLAIINKLKVQSIVFGIIALIGVLLTYYSIRKINQKNIELENSRKSERIAKDSLTRISKRLSQVAVELDIEKNKSNERLINVLNAELNSNNSKQIFSKANKNMNELIALQILTEKKYAGKIIYIQARKDSKVSKNLADNLKQVGFIIPKIEIIDPIRKFGNSIKCFKKEDRGIAQEIQALVYSNLYKQKQKIDSIRVFYIANKSVPKGQFEIWIDK